MTLPPVPGNNYYSAFSDSPPGSPYLYVKLTNGVPSGYAYITGSQYTHIFVTTGNPQYYQDALSGYCLTYNAGENKIDEVSCGSKVSQQWTSVQLSNGDWVIKSSYLGTDQCMTAPPKVLQDITMATCVSGDLSQEWHWALIVG